MSVRFSGQAFPNTQSIAIPGPITLTKNRSVLVGMCWVKLAALPSIDDFDFLVYNDGTDSPSRMRYKLKTFLGDGGLVTVGGCTPDGSTARFFTAPAGALVPGRWTHIAGATDYATSRGYVYVDGVLVGSGAMSAAFGATATSNTDSPRGAIGSLGGGDSEAFQGEMEDVRLYSIHSPNAIKTIATLRGKDSIKAGLLHRWPLKDQRTGNVSTAANFAEAEEIVGLGARNPTWQPDTNISFQKLPFRRNR
jgi:hypothetical protein